MNLLHELTEHALEVRLRLPRQLELHGSDAALADDELAHLGVDGVPSDLLVTGALHDGLLGNLVERDDDLHHADGLRKRAHEVILAEAILLKEILTHDLRNLESALLILRKRVLPDKLDNLLKIILCLQDLLHFLLKHLVLS